MSSSNPNLSLVVFGHVDHGKSTVLGHLLFQMGAVDPREMAKLEDEANTLNMDSWKWAYVLDSLPEEKERGKTSDIALLPISTHKTSFMLIDSPGHRDFVRNMIRGAAQADVGVLMVSVNPSDLKAGLKVGAPGDPGGQTREHAILGSVLGIQPIVVAINKMDLVEWDEKAYDYAKDSIITLFEELRSPWAKMLDKIDFVPISGLEGENLTKRSDKMPWYTGPTFLEALDDLAMKREMGKEGSLRFMTYDVDEQPGAGVVLQGRVVRGTVAVGDKVVVQPGETTCTIREIWINEESVKTTSSGEYSTISLRGLEKEQFQAGIVLCPPTDVAVVPKKVNSKIMLFESLRLPLTVGSSLAMHCGTTYTTATIVSFGKVDHMTPISRRVREQRRNTSGIAFPGEVIETIIETDDPLVIEPFEAQPMLGRLVLRSMGSTVGVGVVNSVE